MRLMQQLNSDMGQTIIMVTHDPGTTRYAKRTLHLDKGKLARDEVVRDRIETHADEVAV
jgi:putative ABC transport system ATP-binding protein